MDDPARSTWRDVTLFHAFHPSTGQDPRIFGRPGVSGQVNLWRDPLALARRHRISCSLTSASFPGEHPVAGAYAGPLGIAFRPGHEDNITFASYTDSGTSSWPDSVLFAQQRAAGGLKPPSSYLHGPGSRMWNEIVVTEGDTPFQVTGMFALVDADGRPLLPRQAAHLANVAADLGPGFSMRWLPEPPSLPNEVSAEPGATVQFIRSDGYRFDLDGDAGSLRFHGRYQASCHGVHRSRWLSPEEFADTVVAPLVAATGDPTLGGATLAEYRRHDERRQMIRVRRDGPGAVVAASAITGYGDETVYRISGNGLCVATTHDELATARDWLDNGLPHADVRALFAPVCRPVEPDEAQAVFTRAAHLAGDPALAEEVLAAYAAGRAHADLVQAATIGGYEPTVLPRNVADLEPIGPRYAPPTARPGPVASTQARPQPPHPTGGRGRRWPHGGRWSRRRPGGPGR